MEWLGTGTNLVMVIVGFGVLIAVHEFGHFVAAKWAGVRVDGFAVGMGPVAISYRRGIGVRLGSTEPEVRRRFGGDAITIPAERLRDAGVGETEYSLRVLPLGGFVRMLGQDDLNAGAACEDPRSYTKAPIAKRMVIVSAGVACNLLLAVVLFVGAFLVGVRFDAPVIGSVVPGSPAEEAGLQAGDRVRTIDGHPATTFSDVQIAAAMARPGASLSVVLDRPARSGMVEVTRSVTPRQNAAAGMLTIGVTPASSTTLTDDPEAQPHLRRALEQAGFDPTQVAGACEGGAELVSLSGAPVHTYEAVVDAARAGGGAPLETRWRIAGSTEVSVALPTVPSWQALQYTQKPSGVPLDYELGFLGLSPLVKIGRVPEESPCAGMLQDGDVILRVAEIDGPRQIDFRGSIAQHAGGTVGLRVLRAGAAVDLSAPVTREGRLGVEITSAWELPLIARPFATTGPPPGIPTAAHDCNPMPLSRFSALDGTPIADWEGLFRAVKARIAASGGAQALALTLTPPTPGATPEACTLQLSEADGTAIAALGWRPALGAEWFRPAEVTLSADGNPLRAISMGFHETHKLVLMTYLTLDRLIRGSVGVSQLRGPVGIVHIGTRIADRGVTYLVFFLAMISVNLAVINFLPIPIADGGLMVFLIYERLRGKPPSPAFQHGAMVAGLVIVGLLFAVTFYYDIMRLVG